MYLYALYYVRLKHFLFASHCFQAILYFMQFLSFQFILFKRIHLFILQFWLY